MCAFLSNNLTKYNRHNEVYDWSCELINIYKIDILFHLGSFRASNPFDIFKKKLHDLCSWMNHKLLFYSNSSTKRVIKNQAKWNAKQRLSPLLFSFALHVYAPFTFVLEALDSQRSIYDISRDSLNATEDWNAYLAKRAVHESRHL